MKLFTTLLISLLLTSCAGPLTKEKATEQLSASSEFSTPFYAPLHIGKQILTADNHDNPQSFIKDKYGLLIDAELLEVKIEKSNSWRTTIHIGLTEKGRAMSDTRRADDEHVYVEVCRLMISSIDTLKPISQDGKVVECGFRFQEDNITPFGQHLGFQQGRTHSTKRTLVRSSGSWDIIKLEN